MNILNKKPVLFFRYGSMALLLLPLMISPGCNYFTKKDTAPEQNKKIARVYDKTLYQSDLNNLVPKGTSKSDSIVMVRGFIESWIKKNVVLKKASDNLGDVHAEIDKKLEEYRNSLEIYLYEEALVRQQLDTVVSEDEIAKYYADNESNFELKENIVQGIFVKVKNNTPRLDKLRNWINSNDAKSRLQLEDYCHQFAIKYFLNDDRWITLDELLHFAEIKAEDKEPFLQKYRAVEVADSANITFVRVHDFKIKDALSPLEFERDHIRALLINKRKLLLVQQMEKDAYDNALKKNDFEIYKK